jgi:hypothetical protein
MRNSEFHFSLTRARSAESLEHYSGLPLDEAKHVALKAALPRPKHVWPVSSYRANTFAPNREVKTAAFVERFKKKVRRDRRRT